MAMSRQKRRSKCCCFTVDFCKIPQQPASKDKTRKGRRMIKIYRQPRLETMIPPNVGPTAGAIPVIRLPKPIIIPIF